MKSKLFKTLEIICHVLGFPVFLLTVIILDLKLFKNGAGYGIFPYGSVLLVLLGGIIYYAAYFILRKKIKKQKEKDKEKISVCAKKGVKLKIAHPARKVGVILAIIVIVCTCGLWAVVDLALPDVIADATSSTIYWEDLSDNWTARSDVNKELLNTFITRSYYAGTLSDKTLDEYLNEGIKNDEVSTLLKKEFASIDKNGYGTLIGPSIDFATNSRMTIPALVHLILDEREPIKDENGNRLDEKIPITTFKAVYVADSESDEVVTNSLYTYMRSAGNYLIFNQKTDQTGSVGSGEAYALEEIASVERLKTYEQRPGYLKVQYLDATSGSSSYNYIIDTNGGNLHFDYTEVVKDSVIREIEVTQKSNDEFILVVLENETVYSYVIKGSDILLKNNDLFTFNYGATFTYDRSINGETDVTAGTNTINSFDDQVLSNALVNCGEFLSHANDEHGVWKDDSFDPSMFADCIILEKTTTEIYATWNALDMLGEPMGINLPLDAIMDISFMGINVGDLLTENPHLINDVFATVSALASNDLLAGSNLSITLDVTTGDITLIPVNEDRGALDYMRSSWLNSNGLIFLLVSLFSLRKVTLIYAPILAILSYAIGVLLELADKEKEKQKLQTPED